MLARIKKWWNGTNPIRTQDMVTGKIIINKPAKRPLIVNLANKIFINIKKLGLFFKKEWKVLIPIFFTILNFIYAYSINQANKKNNEEYKRCNIQTESNKVVVIKCLK